nr:hypothetical protein [Micromonospora sp. KC213]
MAAKTSRDVAPDIAFLTRALKAPSLVASVERLAEPTDAYVSKEHLMDLARKLDILAGHGLGTEHQVGEAVRRGCTTALGGGSSTAAAGCSARSGGAVTSSARAKAPAR